MALKAHYALYNEDDSIFGIVTQDISQPPPENSIKVYKLIDDRLFYIYRDSMGSPWLKRKEELNYSISYERYSVRLKGLPDGLLVLTNGTQAVTDGEEVIVNYDIPGTYKIHIRGLAKYAETVLEVTIGDT